MFVDNDGEGRTRKLPTGGSVSACDLEALARALSLCGLPEIAGDDGLGTVYDSPIEDDPDDDIR